MVIAILLGSMKLHLPGQIKFHIAKYLFRILIVSSIS